MLFRPAKALANLPMTELSFFLVLLCFNREMVQVWSGFAAEYLFTDSIALAKDHDDSCMILALSHRLCMETAKIPDVKRIQHAPVLGGMLQLCPIILLRHSRLEHSCHIYPACS